MNSKQISQHPGFKKLLRFETPPDGDKLFAADVIDAWPSEDVLNLAYKLSLDQLSDAFCEAVGSFETTHPSFKRQSNIEPLLKFFRQIAGVEEVSDEEVEQTHLKQTQNRLNQIKKRIPKESIQREAQNLIKNVLERSEYEPEYGPRYAVLLRKTSTWVFDPDTGEVLSGQTGDVLTTPEGKDLIFNSIEDAEAYFDEHNIYGDISVGQSSE